jgi:rubredoxin
MRLPDQLSVQAKTVSCDTHGVVDAAETRHNPPDDTQGTQKPPGRGYTEHKKSRRSMLLPAPELFHFDKPILTIRYYAGRRMVLAAARALPGRRTFELTPARGIFNTILSNEKKESVVSEVLEYKSWVCLICGWIYNEEDGLPEDGIAAGTRFADIPDTWRCPLCDVGKDDFVAVEF